MGAWEPKPAATKRFASPWITVLRPAINLISPQILRASNSVAAVMGAAHVNELLPIGRFCRGFLKHHSPGSQRSALTGS
ncbi:hypothetical protein pRALTA_0263 (plasmid) [Cupriavidus taiwanensis LMG 19424]|uniref:Uncharacterized protein n=1 Tax=Cupriavidus taiwanensis (strain DSM 17343 / BCRC 17206 / CCUG 44338 / CIP 107171 / LMG 19424 / R1) TaxID=977880 RepID=B2AKB0_CUPTR|nr:hypothetical protein pRALTA_0263 [Cupriavidus taiwanensis LMG 19424]SPD37266.1 conserved protein of unknown function [Cupriavidus taiwanensis]